MCCLVGEDRYQSSFIPRSLDEMIDENNRVRVIDAYVGSIERKLKGLLRRLQIITVSKLL